MSLQFSSEESDYLDRCFAFEAHTVAEIGTAVGVTQQIKGKGLRADKWVVGRRTVHVSLHETRTELVLFVDGERFLLSDPDLIEKVRTFLGLPR